MRLSTMNSVSGLTSRLFQGKPAFTTVLLKFTSTIDDGVTTENLLLYSEASTLFFALTLYQYFVLADKLLSAYPVVFAGNEIFVTSRVNKESLARCNSYPSVSFSINVLSDHVNDALVLPVGSAYRCSGFRIVTPGSSSSIISAFR